MAYEQKNGQGALFKNAKKTTGDSSPDYKGDITVNGTAFWIAGWMKESKGGKKYMSLAVTPKDGTVKKQDEDTIPF